MPEASKRPRVCLGVSDLTAGYGESPVVQNVSLQVGDGEIVAMVGPNGAGKSTMLKAILGIATLHGGRVTLHDQPVTNTRLDLLAKHGVGYVPQIEDTFRDLTVRENLEMGGYLLGTRELADRMDAVLTIFHPLSVMMTRSAGQLSGGERKMLAVARALMPQPTILLLDEPTANLSPKLSDDILTRQLPAIAESGTGVLIVEQKVRAVLEAADWAYVLISGSVQLSDSGVSVGARTDLADIFLAVQAPGVVSTTGPSKP